MPAKRKKDTVKKRARSSAEIFLRRVLLAAMDCGLIALGLYIGLLLRGEGAGEEWLQRNVQILYRHLPWMVTIYIIVFLAGGLYSILWKYAGVRDLLRLCILVGVSTVLVLVGNEMVHGVLYRSATVIGAAVALAAIGGIRLAWRAFLNKPDLIVRGRVRNDAHTPLMIVGAGNAGAWAINLCKSNVGYGTPVVAVDDDPAKQNQTIQGVPVRGTLDDIAHLCDEYGIREIIIAITSLRGSTLNRVVDLCNATRCRVRILRDPQALGETDAVPHSAFRELNTADFLSRDEVTLDTEKINAYLKGKTVLVTGGGGSIGSELCRQIMRCAPARLLIFDVYENCAYELEMELKQKYGREVPVTVLVGTIRDKNRLDEVMRTYHPTVVFHAAAHKHVPLMEISPAEAVKNNVLGTKNLLASASEHGVQRLVQLSTDKAVNPTSVMGCTKRICEMLIQSFAGRTEMQCVAVRFGNVLGSHGSVIPLFESQIKSGGPVTVTDPNIVRYFM
ncbi:MAG: polysaccharide biosynthesis protein, partial [Faecalibacterium sp.]|nr:polysaccharide biosynthesis protein [Faecalibacterium sp.]